MRAEGVDAPMIDEADRLVTSLGSALGGLDLGGVDADGVARLVAVLRTAQATIDASLVRVGIRADELASDGVGVPARDALSGAGRVRGSTARREAGRVRLAARSPRLRRAMGSGRFGPDHLDALVRHLGRLDADHLARVDLGALLERAPALPAGTFAAALRRAVDAAAADDAAGEDEAGAARARSAVRHWFDHRTGMGCLSAQLDPERYEAVIAALDHHTTALANATGGEKNASLAAEALVELICGSGQRRTHLPHVTVVVDRTTLQAGRHPGSTAETGDGHPLPDAALARLCCDAVLRRVVLDPHGVPIEVGRRHRTATDAQWAALRAVHSTCAWAGCDRPLGLCQAHHIRPWQHGGATDLDNLVPLCSHHHHLVHEGRWTVELGADRSLAITRPDGHHHTTTSPPTRRPPPIDSVPPMPSLAGHRTLTTP